MRRELQWDVSDREGCEKKMLGREQVKVEVRCHGGAGWRGQEGRGLRQWWCIAAKRKPTATLAPANAGS